MSSVNCLLLWGIWQFILWLAGRFCRTTPIRNADRFIPLSPNNGCHLTSDDLSCFCNRTSCQVHAYFPLVCTLMYRCSNFLWDACCFPLYIIKSKIEKIPRDIQDEKSRKPWQVRENCSQQLASPKNGTDPGVRKNKSSRCKKANRLGHPTGCRSDNFTTF